MSFACRWVCTCEVLLLLFRCTITVFSAQERTNQREKGKKKGSKKQCNLFVFAPKQSTQKKNGRNKHWASELEQNTQKLLTVSVPISSLPVLSLCSVSSSHVDGLLVLLPWLGKDSSDPCSLVVDARQVLHQGLPGLQMRWWM